MMKAFLNDLADWIPIFIFGGIVATISVVGALAPYNLFYSTFNTTGTK
jgi:hypothetical protein